MMQFILLLAALLTPSLGAGGPKSDGATEHIGATQPVLVPGWNPGGYANNQAMMVDLEVTPTALSQTQQPPSGLHHSEEEMCEVCGHEYDPLKDCGGMDNPSMACGQGISFDDLPDSWRCPVCGAPKKKYELLHAHSTSAPAPPSKTGDMQCVVCQHVYNAQKDCGGMDALGKDCGEGVPFESLPDSWRCPQCGADKAHYHASHPTEKPTSAAEQGSAAKAASVAKQSSAAKQAVEAAAMQAVGSIVVSAGLYICVALVSSVTVMVVFGLATKKLLLIAVLSSGVVVSVKLAFSTMPPLLVGHAVGMLVCWSFMMVGSVLYRSMASSTGVPQKLQARVPHAVLMSCACLIAIVGVACIYENHALMGASQFGLDSAPLPNRLHAQMGWCIVALMLLQGSQGWLKYLNLRSGTMSYFRHPQLGRAVLLLSSCNIMLILWAFKAQMGNNLAMVIAAAVVLVTVLACLISGPQPALARVDDDSDSSRYEAMPT